MKLCKRKGVMCECLTDHSVCNTANCHRKLPDIGFTSEEVKQSLEDIDIELVDGELNMEKSEFFEGTKWLVEKREGYWVPNIIEKSVIKLPKCAYCGKVFGTVGLTYNYCPQCGENMRLTRRKR